MIGHAKGIRTACKTHLIVLKKYSPFRYFLPFVFWDSTCALALSVYALSYKPYTWFPQAEIQQENANGLSYFKQEIAECTSWQDSETFSQARRLPPPFVSCRMVVSATSYSCLVTCHQTGFTCLITPHLLIHAALLLWQTWAGKSSLFTEVTVAASSFQWVAFKKVCFISLSLLNLWGCQTEEHEM